MLAGAYGRGQQNSGQQRLLWPRRVEDVVVDGLQGRQESHGDGDGAPAPASVGRGRSCSLEQQAMAAT